MKHVSRKAFYLTIEILALAGVLLTLAVLALLWRLNQAPLDVSFLNSQIVHSLSASYPSLDVKLRKSEVHWEVDEHEARLELHDLSLTDKVSNEEVLRLPRVDVSVALKPLAVGRIVPSEIIIDSAQLDLTRNEGGGIALGFASGNDALVLVDDAANTSQDDAIGSVLAASDMFFSRLHAEANTSDTLSYLEQVRLTNARVSFTDLGLSHSFFAEDSDLVLKKTPLGLEGNLDGRFFIGGQAVSANLKVTRIQKTKITNVKVDFQNLNLKGLSALHKSFELLDGIGPSLDGIVTANLDPFGNPTSGSFKVFAGNGNISMPRFWNKKLPLKALQAEGVFDLKSRSMFVEDSTIIVGRDNQKETMVKFSGSVSDEGKSFLLNYQLSADQIAVKEIATYWPSGFPSSTRNWVLERAVDGQLANMEFDNEIRVRKKKGSKVEKIRGFISFDFSGLSLQPYLKIETVEGASGRIQIIDDHIDVTMRGGTSEGVAINEATVVISKNGLGKKQLDTKMQVTCEAKSCMALLKKIGLKSQAFLRLKEQVQAGQVAAAVNLSLPMPKLKSSSAGPTKVDPNQVFVAFAANVERGLIVSAVGKEDLRNANLEISGDKKEIRVSGHGELAGATNNFDAVFRSNFSSNPGATVRAAGNFPAAGLERILPGLTRYINGSVAVEISYQKATGNEATVGFSADLSNASIVFPPIDYSKQTGQPANAAGLVHLSYGKPYAISEFSIQAPSLATAGNIRVRPDGKDWERMTLSRLEFAGNQFSNVNLVQSADFIDIHAEKGLYDAAPLFEKLSSKSAQTASVNNKATVITVDHIETLGLPKGKSVTNVSLSLRQRNGGIEELNFTGYAPPLNGKRQVGTNGFIQARLAQNHRGEYQMDVTTDDGGALLDTFGIWSSSRYGRLRVKAVAAQPFPLSPIRVGTRMDRFTILNTPTLTQLLSFASLTGIVDVLNGKGLFFERLDSIMTYHKGKIQMDELRMKGPSLGIRLSGQIDNNAKRLALKGTIAPFNFVTQLVDGVPLLRDIVNGVKGEGILAANFRLDGRMQKPKVSVNPLASIAPGIVRDVFGDILGNDFVGL